MTRDDQLESAGIAVANATESSVATSVLLCQGLETLGHGVDLTELRQWLEETYPGVQVRVMPDLCQAPKGLFHPASIESQRIVLGLCYKDYSELEMQSRFRKAGLDPLSIEAVILGAFCTLVKQGSQGTEKAKLLLAAAIAKVRAYPGSSPDNLKPCFSPLSQQVSRRALFTLPPLQYKVVASIDDQCCVARASCNLCVQACPGGALERADEKIWVNKMRCDGCGLCLTACPKDAVQLPGSSAAQLEAQIVALLETNPVALRERRLLFICQRSIQAIEEAGQNGVGASAHWLPVQLPCVGMVPVGCLLQCVARGATVGVLSCGDGCPPGQYETIQGRIDYCCKSLQKLGGPATQVRLVKLEEGPGVDQPLDGIGVTAPEGCEGGGPHTPMFGPEALADALGKLADKYRTPATLTLKHPYSPVGVVAVNPERCTGCGVCAGSCPTGALGFQRGDNQVSLTFNAASCIACGQCVAVCPEAGAGAIRVDRVTDLDRLGQGQTILHRDMEARCEACGAPVASLSMLNRIAALLGSDEGALVDRIGRYCSSCKGSK
ncbi:MAG: 4Fe-4S binding protein [Dehalococcoidia bacterium]